MLPEKVFSHLIESVERKKTFYFYVFRLINTCITLLYFTLLLDKDMISFVLAMLFSVPSLMLAFKLSTKQVPKSIFNQTSFFLFFSTGTINIVLKQNMK